MIRVEEGSLYPALQRMRQKGWIKAEWRQTANNQRARYYALTAAGRAAARRSGRRLRRADGRGPARHAAGLKSHGSHHARMAEHASLDWFRRDALERDLREELDSIAGSSSGRTPRAARAPRRRAARPATTRRSDANHGRRARTLVDPLARSPAPGSPPRRARAATRAGIHRRRGRHPGARDRRECGDACRHRPPAVPPARRAARVG